MTNIITGDALTILRGLPDGACRCAVTSPPYYGLRDYGVDGQLGGEDSPEEYIDNLVVVFREVRRVLADDGTLWLNIGDSYSGSDKGQVRGGGTGDPKRVKQHDMRLKRITMKGVRPKNLIGIPWMLAFALRADGWYLRQDIIWNKTNAMPESVRDRCTKSHEYLFLLSKSPRYYFDCEAIAEPASAGSRGSRFDTGKTAVRQLGRAGAGERAASSTRRRRSVWNIPTQPYHGAHPAAFPIGLVRPCVLAGSEPGDVILDPFCGSGTAGIVAEQEGRGFVGIEINPEYAALARQRIDEAKQKIA